MKNWLIPTALLAVLALSHVCAAPRKTIAIVDFGESGSEIKGLNGMVSAYLEEIIQELGRLTVVERSRIEAVLSEHQLTMSGIVNEASAVEFGGLLGVNFLLFGDIVQGTITAPVHKEQQNYGFDRVKQVRVPTTFETWNEITATTRISIKIVDVANGSVKYSETAGSQKTKRLDQKQYRSKTVYAAEMARERKRDTAESIIALLTRQKLEVKPENLDPVNRAVLSETLQDNIYSFRRNLFFAFPIEGIVLKVIDEKTVLIDIGTDGGAKPGTKCEVYRMEAPIAHPVTGKLIENRTRLDGTLEIDEVQGPETSVASGKKKFIATIKAGDIVLSRKQVLIPR